MQRPLLTLFFSLLLTGSYAQYYEENYQEEEETSEKAALTIGILQGGGSLIGADLEVLLTQQVGLQVGAGLVGFGAAVNVHLKPTIRSSMISMTYWNQGTGQSFVQNAVGPSFVYRGEKWFTAQIGLGKLLGKGPAFPEDVEQPPFMLLYSIGGYIPFQ